MTACALTGGLRLAGVLRTAGQVIAYSAVLMALGTIGLAAGTIGMLAEQRRASQQQSGQLSARTADVAQVEIERFSGPNEMVRINVRNGCERAIRNVYVWADVRGVTGHYAAGVPVEDPLSRRMANVPHDEGLCWQLRVIRPGRQAFFAQLINMNPDPLPALADADITAFAEFTDVDGTWWRCDEDGNVSRRQPAPQPAGGPERVLTPEIPTGEIALPLVPRGLSSVGRAAPWLARLASRAIPAGAPRRGASHHRASDHRASDHRASDHRASGHRDHGAFDHRAFDHGASNHHATPHGAPPLQ